MCAHPGGCLKLAHVTKEDTLRTGWGNWIAPRQTHKKNYVAGHKFITNNILGGSM